MDSVYFTSKSNLSICSTLTNLVYCGLPYEKCLETASDSRCKCSIVDQCSLGWSYFTDVKTSSPLLGTFQSTHFWTRKPKIASDQDMWRTIWIYLFAKAIFINPSPPTFKHWDEVGVLQRQGSICPFFLFVDSITKEAFTNIFQGLSETTLFTKPSLISVACLFIINCCFLVLSFAFVWLFWDCMILYFSCLRYAV